MVIANVTREENNRQPLQRLQWLHDNRHKLVAAPRDRVMEPQENPVRMMTVTVNEIYRWSRESKTIKTESQFKVSYHQERRVGTANWALFSSNEETVKKKGKILATSNQKSGMDISNSTVDRQPIQPNQHVPAN